MKHKFYWLLNVGMILFLFRAQSCFGQESADEKYDLDISAQPLSYALNELASQTNTLVLFPYDLVDNRKGSSVRGRYTVLQGAEAILQGTDLVGDLSRKGVLTVSLKKPKDQTEQLEKPMKTKKTLLAQALSFLTTLSIFGVSSAASAQTDGPIEEIVVKGVRFSLETAVAQKREADFVVDGIAAEDLGKFPDANVAESLQRVTGVAITRRRGVGQRISVRGLGPEYNTVSINGRLMATDEPGREFNFDLLPSELISGANVVKSPTASMTEGSIGGSVDIKTARPLDYDGFKAAISYKHQYAKLGSESSPQFSGVVSNTFDNGKLGALFSFAYKDEAYRTDAYNPAALENTFGTPLVGVVADKTPGAGTRRQIGVWRPDSQRFQRRVGDRKRIGFGTSLQWEPNDKFSATLDGIYSRYEEVEIWNSMTIPIYDAFRSASTLENGSPRVDVSSLQFYAPYGSVPNSQNTILAATVFGDTPFGPLDGNVVGQRIDNVMERLPRFSDSHILGLNLNYDVTEDITINADISTSRAKLDGEGDDKATLLTVTGFNGGSATYQSRTGTVPIVTFSNNRELNPALFRTHYSRISNLTITDDIDEFKLDANWRLNTSILASVQAGFATSERRKVKTEARSPNPGANSGYQTDVPDDIFNAPIRESDFMEEESGDFPRAFVDYDQRRYLAYLETLQPGNQYTPVLQPGRGFDVEEKTRAFFIQANFDGEMGDMPWRGNLGVRYVSTDVTSTGVTNIFRSFTPRFSNPAKDNVDPILEVDAGALVSVESDYDDTLFSANFAMDLTEELVLRAAAAEVLTRPTLTNLSTGISFNRLLSANAGNPNLEPYRGKQYDLALEWYPSESTSLSATYFNKDLSSFVSRVTQSETFTATNPAPGTNAEVVFETTRPRNGENASIDGWEFAALHSFGEEAGLFNGFGIQASLTLIDSKAQFDSSLSNRVFSVEGLSDQAYSVVAFYDRGKWHGRISFTHRSDYLNRAFGSFGQPELVDDTENVDISLSYDVTDNITISLEGNNITNERFHMYQVYQHRVRDIEYSGARYWLGVRASF